MLKDNMSRIICFHTCSIAYHLGRSYVWTESGDRPGNNRELSRWERERKEKTLEALFCVFPAFRSVESDQRFYTALYSSLLPSVRRKVAKKNHTHQRFIACIAVYIGA